MMMPVEPLTIGQARLLREGQSLLDGLRQHHGLPLRVARHGTHLLVLDVVGTQAVAMAQQDAAAEQFYRVRIL